MLTSVRQLLMICNDWSTAVCKADSFPSVMIQLSARRVSSAMLINSAPSEITSIYTSGLMAGGPILSFLR